MLLNILYWVILVLCGAGSFWPLPPDRVSLRFFPWVALFVIIGLRAFKVSFE